MAEYTGVRFALDVTRTDLDEIARKAEAFEARPSYVRSLGYGTGPALGLPAPRRFPPGSRRRRLNASVHGEEPIPGCFS